MSVREAIGLEPLPVIVLQPVRRGTESHDGKTVSNRVFCLGVLWDHRFRRCVRLQKILDGI